ncbi:hypothetical protein GIB67_038993 [Kingdonia uniflora]|uniref:Uncharacterized protein n=1 Tax=Kingdonia uniflora TaxID=39325 RepID=A0A7J7P6W1_9MAGN|nr:hypothetical protein GIB67_038993 [Kingdonia uniflora]
MEGNGYTRDGTVDFQGRPVLASKTGKWKACAFLLCYEAFERMAFFGIASNLVTYLTTQLRGDTVSSVRNANNWSGSVWLTPIFGAYVTNTYFGRFWTFTASAVVYITTNLTISILVRKSKKTLSSIGGCLALTWGYWLLHLGLCTPYYRHKVRNTKSPAKDLIRVPIDAIKSHKLALPSDPSKLHELEPQHYNTGKR